MYLLKNYSLHGLKMKATSFQVLWELSNIIPNSDTLLYDYTKVIGFVREIVQVISIL